MTSKQTPALGNYVTDATTGFSGIAFQLVELMSGSIQLAVQPKLAEGQSHTGTADAVPAAMNIDIQLLDFVNDGIAARVLPTQEDNFELGNVVKSIVTGIKGTLTARHTFINGCVYYHVMPKQTKAQIDEGKTPESIFAATNALELVNAGVAPKMAQTLAKPVSDRTGGPSTKAMRPS